MSRRGGSDEPFLFDLPLVPDGEREEAAEPPPPRRPPARDRDPRLDEAPATEELPLFGTDPLAERLPGEALAEDEGEDDEGAGGFPFSDRPPPHRPAPQRTAPHPASPHPASPRPAAHRDAPAGWDVVDVAAAPAGATAAAPSAPDAAPRDTAPHDTTPRPARLLPRLAAAAVDGGVLVAVAALAVAGAAMLGVRSGLAALPGLAALLFVFSFAYAVVPLAFWGATPGMAAARLVARDRDGGPLSFGQTALRWLAALLTLALAGLPLLLALTGRSPADRLSRSTTWRRAASP